MRVISSETVFKGKMIEVRVDHILEPHGIEARRELVCHGGSVVVMPRLARDQILLVRQFRYPARQALWELVAGGIERGETPRRAAARELKEEAGCSARSFRLLFTFYPSPGVLSEKMHLYEALHLTRGDAQPEADERLEIRRFSHRQLKEMVRRNRIQDGKTLIGLLWFFGQRR